ncbi:hypothetical protein ACFPT7_08960 [Acidicapsa dinghuensis]|uniref:Uncharacterized protein n=1 Tax=Acidicapsa dinghuensis TaxID=2218256 RepID=A0ABW1EEB8_9BACT
MIYLAVENAPRSVGGAEGYGQYWFICAIVGALAALDSWVLTFRHIFYGDAWQVFVHLLGIHIVGLIGIAFFTSDWACEVYVREHPERSAMVRQKFGIIWRAALILFYVPVLLSDFHRDYTAHPTRAKLWAGIFVVVLVAGIFLKRRLDRRKRIHAS